MRVRLRRGLGRVTKFEGASGAAIEGEVGADLDEGEEKLWDGRRK